MTTTQEYDDARYPPFPSPSGIQAFLLSYKKNVSDRVWKLTRSINNEDAALDTTTTITTTTTTTTPQEQEQQPVDDNSNNNSNSNANGDGDDDHHDDDALRNEFESLMNSKLGGELRGGFERCVLGSSSWVPPPYTQMPYCHQLETWDCGVACYIMMSRWLRLSTSTSNSSSNFSSNSKQPEWTATLLPEEVQERQELLQAMGGGESIWTADLVLQIHKRLLTVHCHYLYCSTSMQVTEDYQNLGYYRDSFRNDQSRVAKTFDELKGLRASSLLCSSPQQQQKQPLSLPCVIHAVCHPDCVAMVLLDNYVLLHSTTKQDGTSTTNGGDEEEEEDNYTGHYVLLCGISRDQRHVQSAYKYDDDDDDGAALEGLGDEVEEDYCLVLCNPGQQVDAYMFVTPRQFERSWRAKGTDEDIVFIVRRPNE
jgi:hypothetical protein